MIEHIIESVADNSIAAGLGIVPGDVLLRVNGQEIEDIFDYQYQCENVSVDIEIRKSGAGEGDSSVIKHHIQKDEDEDIGLMFGAGLMDDYRRCSNKCIFCFIDQNPQGMRETIYFKDDDARLSFLQGNYITLTNMSDHDIDRVIKYRLQPVNISFQSMNPELRCKMLNNRFAGEALKKVDRLYEAGLEMNGQIVLCKNVNDGDELEYSLSKLYEYVPVLRSVSVVPVGLSDHREGLYHLEPFTPEDALDVIGIIERWQKKAYSEHGIHFVHASDEWYINAGIDLPAEETYDGYLQIENGVGMLRSLIEEVKLALEDKCEEYGRTNSDTDKDGDPVTQNDSDAKGFFSRIISSVTSLAVKRPAPIKEERITVITGRLAQDHVKKMMNDISRAFPEKDINVLAVRNDFFGEKITVTGLLTGSDIIRDCKEYVSGGETLGSRLLLPENVLRSGTDVLLDDMTVSDIRDALHIQVDIVKSSGYDMLDCILYE